MPPLTIALVSGAAICALGLALIDSHLQGYRDPRAPDAAYWIVPVRLQRDLYLPEKRHLVGRAWWCFAGMMVFALLALVAG
jgi:hypothetical protein